MTQPLLYLALGLALGGVIGWLLGNRSRTGAPNAEAQKLENELRQQVSQREAEVAQLRQQTAQASQEQARAEAGRAAAEKVLAEQKQWHEEQMRAAREAQEKALNDLREAFRALSADTLKKIQPEFLQLANETLAKFHETAKGDLEQRQTAVAAMVEPLKVQLETYQKRLQQSETTQAAALGEVKKHLESLASQSQSLAGETLQLRRVLSSSQARGRWGEETLRRVVEAAGMSAHCDFIEQVQAGESKPDLLVRLPGDRVIIVDAKVPDLEFLQALDATDVARRTQLLEEHASKLKSTIKGLADRNYPRQFPNALDYVVLFLPAESLFSAALEGDHELIVWAASRRILLATPASLIALLRAVSVSWQQQSQAENARAIAEAAQELYNRVSTFTEHLEAIRGGLKRAGDAYNAAVGSYERSVRPSGERLVKLSGGAGGKVLTDLEEIDTTLRLPPSGNT